LRPKPCLLAMREQLREVVASKLLLDWSPEQISGWLTTQYSSDESYARVPRKIYRSLFIQARGVLKKSWWGICDPAPHTPLAALSYLQRLARSNRRCHLHQGKDPQKSRTAPFPAIGRVIY